MRVRVLFFGVLKDIVGASEDVIDVAPGTNLDSVFSSYSQRFETLRDKRPSILFARNREFSRGDTMLAENDEIAFLPPVSGGSGHQRANRCWLTRDPIDAKQLVDELLRPEDGASVVFEGVVRNNTKGRPTLYLEYECYEPMALEQMKRISHEIAEKFAIGHIGLVHRLGRLEISEASVAIVTTAPHRKAAFDAAFEAINRLKREVPIWKKEFFADGAVWVEGEWDEKLRSMPVPDEVT
ncbi:MAG TPA: molybdenum cofactor biosynthesis protein MoaE [Bryobacteraceae bacterium]|nr:molybdenum cofactor biosynthesis protein MoaE [Bryobacteraceae bacterium]